jgi:hypothetical protein
MKPLLCSLLSVFAFSLNAQAPTAVPIPKEPHHHLVLENDYVRVFRVSVPAHEATLLHQHDVPYVYVSLGPADVINAVQGKPEAHLVMADGQLGYSRGGFAHIARNESDAPFNNVTIELLHPQGEPRNLCAQIVPGAASGGCDKTLASTREGRISSVEPQMETVEMNLDLVHLGPEAKSRGIAVPPQSLLIALNESEIQVDVEGKPTHTLHGGEVTWIDAGSHRGVFNPGKKLSGYLQLSVKASGSRTKP